MLHQFIKHGRRHILHFNATHHPTSAWVIQQLREAFPDDTAPRNLIFDRDSIFSPAVVEFMKRTQDHGRFGDFIMCMALLQIVLTVFQGSQLVYPLARGTRKNRQTVRYP